MHTPATGKIRLSSPASLEASRNLLFRHYAATGCSCHLKTPKTDAYQVAFVAARECFRIVFYCYQSYEADYCQGNSDSSHLDKLADAGSLLFDVVESMMWKMDVRPKADHVRTDPAPNEPKFNTIQAAFTRLLKVVENCQTSHCDDKITGQEIGGIYDAAEDLMRAIYRDGEDDIETQASAPSKRYFDRYVSRVLTTVGAAITGLSLEFEKQRT